MIADALDLLSEEQELFDEEWQAIRQSADPKHMGNEADMKRAAWHAWIRAQNSYIRRGIERITDRAHSNPTTSLNKRWCGSIRSLVSNE